MGKAGPTAIPITKIAHAQKKAPHPICPSCMMPIAQGCGCKMRGGKKIKRSNEVRY
jgi:hypothetical protein